MTNRALRRDQKERAKRRVKAYRVCENQTENLRHVGILSKTPKPCSCYMCGNPRGWWGEQTSQECKQDLKELGNY